MAKETLNTRLTRLEELAAIPVDEQGKRQDERIDKLASAIGELIRRTDVLMSKR